MAGLIFIKTTNLEEIIEFYMQAIGMKQWISQPDIEILRHDNLLVGFQQADTNAKDFLLTFFYNSREEVDRMYNKLEHLATTEPSENSKYKIYNFFAKDPQGRDIEFQTFLHKLPPY